MVNFEKFESKKYEKEKTDQENIREVIGWLIENGKTKLGEGKTAEVYFHNKNPEVCFKVITNPNNPQLYNDVQKEGKFLERAKKATEEVKIPTPWYYAKTKYTPKEESEKKVGQFLAMERLNALTLKEVRDEALYDKEFPEKFKNLMSNVDEHPVKFMRNFFQKVKKDVGNLNDNNIYHRDLHLGNIMIDVENGTPCIIDFGSSTEAFSQEDARNEIRVGKEDTVFAKDSHQIEASQESFNRIESKLSELT